MIEDSETALNKVEYISNATLLQFSISKEARVSTTESRANLIHMNDTYIVNGFCEICRQVLDNWGEIVKEYDSESDLIRNSVLGLIKPVKNGCTLCALFMSDANVIF